MYSAKFRVLDVVRREAQYRADRGLEYVTYVHLVDAERPAGAIELYLSDDDLAEQGFKVGERYDVSFHHALDYGGPEQSEVAKGDDPALSRDGRGAE